MTMGAVGVAPGTTTIRLPDGRVVALTDWIDDKFYGTIEFQNADQQPILAFSTGLSQVIPGGTRTSTELDTNLPRNGDSGLPQDWEFLCYGWGIKLVRVMRAGTLEAFSDYPNSRTFFEFDRRVFFRYRYNRKDYTEGTLSDYPQGHGLYLTTTTSNRDIAQNGRPSPRDRVALVLPVHHRMNLSFAGEFRPIIACSIDQPASDEGSNLTFMDIKLYDFGLIRRIVV